MGLFKKVETPEETYIRIDKLTTGEDCGMFHSPMDAQVALMELCHFFLGDDWYVTAPISVEQMNTEIVYEIEREFIKYNKHKNNKEEKKNENIK